MHDLNYYLLALGGAVIFFGTWYLIEKFWPKGK
jgi:hypothetical protein